MFDCGCLQSKWFVTGLPSSAVVPTNSGSDAVAPQEVQVLDIVIEHKQYHKRKFYKSLYSGPSRDPKKCGILQSEWFTLGLLRLRGRTTGCY